MHEQLAKEIGEWMNTMSKEEVQRINDLDREETESIYCTFKESFNKGMCSLCGTSLKTISKEKPCLHWLLRMCKFKKKDFEILYPTVSYFQIYSYVRWVANQGKFMKNINDLNEGKSSSKLIESTIRYKHLEWSFSCSQGDFDGHEGTKTDFPHYHFQMRINGQQFINYNDYHISFTENDIFQLIMISKHGAVESYGTGGTGLQEGFSARPEDIIEYSHVCENEEDATYHVSTIASFEDGISGDEIYKLIEESKQTGQTMTKLLKERGAKVNSVITPHESVPEKAKRTERKK